MCRLIPPILLQKLPVWTVMSPQKMTKMSEAYIRHTKAEYNPVGGGILEPQGAN